MAVDAFLKLDGVAGESHDIKHKDEIELDSFSFGASQTAGGFGGGGGAGKVQFQDVHFSSNTSKASPSMLLACASGKHIPTGLITVRKAGGNPVEYIHIKMTDVLVSSYQVGGGGNMTPTDQVSLNFAKIHFDYAPQDQAGKLLPAVSAGWDVKANKAV